MKKQVKINLSGIFLLFGISLLMSGCASSAKSIPTGYVSDRAYRDWSCDELADEQERISNRIIALAESLDNEATKDIWQTTGAFVLAPFTWGLSLGVLASLEGGDGPEAVEYSRLKGEFEAAGKAQSRKDC